MGDSCHRRDDCRLCGGTDLALVLSLAPTPPANAFVPAEALDRAQETFPLDVFFCRSCGHVQLRDVVDPRLLFENYVYVSGTSPVFVKHFQDYAAAVMDRVAPAAGAWVLDIGSNDGTLLRFFRERGLGVLGVDPAREIARRATEAGIETLADFFSPALARSLRRERGPAAVITANNVFAHADDLRGIAAGVCDLLADDGVFVFEVSYLVDVFEKTLFDTIYHEHLAYHSVAPLRHFFAGLGMELIDVQRVDSHGGSLRGFVQRAGGPRKVEPSVEGLVALESDLGLDRAETLQAFGARIDALGRALTARLGELKAAGKTIAAFGAPAKATTLMYHFAIGPEVVDFIVDDSPLKQGLYSPGMHIPVLPSAALYDRRPDAVVVLAWNFAESIMARHTEYLRGGGRFIVPLPELTERGPEAASQP
ncbi:MAG: class I SAM-dependent methyltransferase [Hyphomicrobiales bacterium]|nr:class I SAM-dependent methyltransferase [Hyphomicrobiales bacterium]MCP5370515.1 class I SAM-dependent methyltransferase [Hyphomicrobiales bacterium]